MATISHPLVLRDAIRDWTAAQWTPAVLASMLQGKKIRFRIGRREHDDVQFEPECCFEDATVREFCEWLEMETEAEVLDNSSCKTKRENPLLKYKRRDYFCYADYKYMVQVFQEDLSVLKQVDWTVLGLPEEKNNDTTLWVGGEGAYTVCHYDTYGWNIVAQVYGRKRWVLFPPSDTECLYPTRVPYEESSVFSRVNIVKPNLNIHPKFKETSPHCVVLEAGDVLCVPRHWWHYVECLEPSISVNTWVEMEEDREERLREAVTRVVLHAVLASTDATWRNPTEEESSTENNMMLLNFSLREIYTGLNFLDGPGVEISPSRDRSAENHTDIEHSPSLHSPQSSSGNKRNVADCDVTENGGKNRFFKKFKSSGKERPADDVESVPEHSVLSQLFPGKQGRYLEKMTFQKYIETVGTETTEAGSSRHNRYDTEIAGESTDSETKMTNNEEKAELSARDFANCLVDSEVIDLICKKVKLKFEETQK